MQVSRLNVRGHTRSKALMASVGVAALILGGAHAAAAACTVTATQTCATVSTAQGDYTGTYGSGGTPAGTLATTPNLDVQFDAEVTGHVTISPATGATVGTLSGTNALSNTITGDLSFSGDPTSANSIGIFTNNGTVGGSVNLGLTGAFGGTATLTNTGLIDIDAKVYAVGAASASNSGTISGTTTVNSSDGAASFANVAGKSGKVYVDGANGATFSNDANSSVSGDVNVKSYGFLSTFTPGSTNELTFTPGAGVATFSNTLGATPLTGVVQGDVYVSGQGGATATNNGSIGLPNQSYSLTVTTIGDTGNVSTAGSNDWLSNELGNFPNHQSLSGGSYSANNSTTDETWSTTTTNVTGGTNTVYTDTNTITAQSANATLTNTGQVTSYAEADATGAATLTNTGAIKGDAYVNDVQVDNLSNSYSDTTFTPTSGPITDTYSLTGTITPVLSTGSLVNGANGVLKGDAYVYGAGGASFSNDAKGSVAGNVTVESVGRAQAFNFSYDTGTGAVTDTYSTTAVGGAATFTNAAGATTADGITGNVIVDGDTSATATNNGTIGGWLWAGSVGRTVAESYTWAPGAGGAGDYTEEDKFTLSSVAGAVSVTNAGSVLGVIAKSGGTIDVSNSGSIGADGVRLSTADGVFGIEPFNTSSFASGFANSEYGYTELLSLGVYTTNTQSSQTTTASSLTLSDTNSTSFSLTGGAITFENTTGGVVSGQTYIDGIGGAAVTNTGTFTNTIDVESGDGSSYAVTNASNTVTTISTGSTNGDYTTTNSFTLTDTGAGGVASFANNAGGVVNGASNSSYPGGTALQVAVNGSGGASLSNAAGATFNANVTVTSGYGFDGSYAADYGSSVNPQAYSTAGAVVGAANGVTPAYYGQYVTSLSPVLATTYTGTTVANYDASNVLQSYQTNYARTDASIGGDASVTNSGVLGLRVSDINGNNIITGGNVYVVAAGNASVTNNAGAEILNSGGAGNDVVSIETEGGNATDTYAESGVFGSSTTAGTTTTTGDLKQLETVTWTDTGGVATLTNAGLIGMSYANALAGGGQVTGAGSVLLYGAGGAVVSNSGSIGGSAYVDAGPEVDNFTNRVTWEDNYSIQTPTSGPTVRDDTITTSQTWASTASTATASLTNTATGTIGAPAVNSSGQSIPSDADIDVAGDGGATIANAGKIYGASVYAQAFDYNDSYSSNETVQLAQSNGAQTSKVDTFTDSYIGTPATGTTALISNSGQINVNNGGDVQAWGYSNGQVQNAAGGVINASTVEADAYGYGYAFSDNDVTTTGKNGAAVSSESPVFRKLHLRRRGGPGLERGRDQRQCDGQRLHHGDGQQRGGRDDHRQRDRAVLLQSVRRWFVPDCTVLRAGFAGLFGGILEQLQQRRPDRGRRRHHLQHLHRDQQHSRRCGAGQQRRHDREQQLLLVRHGERLHLRDDLQRRRREDLGRPLGQLAVHER